MTTFDQREHAFEQKFAQDEEVRFKVHAARNHMLGLWVAEKLGLSGAAAEAYATNLTQSDVAVFQDDQLVRKIMDDFKAKNVPASEAEVRRELERVLAAAKRRIGGH